MAVGPPLVPLLLCNIRRSATAGIFASFVMCAAEWGFSNVLTSGKCMQPNWHSVTALWILDSC